MADTNDLTPRLADENIVRRPYYYRIERVTQPFKNRVDVPAVLTFSIIHVEALDLPPLTRRLVTEIGGRILWTKDNTIADHRLMFINKPDFPLRIWFEIRYRIRRFWVPLVVPHQ